MSTCEIPIFSFVLGLILCLIPNINSIDKIDNRDYSFDSSTRGRMK